MCLILYFCFKIVFPLSFLRLLLGPWAFGFYVFVAGWRHALRSEWPFKALYYWYLLGGKPK